MPFSQSAIMLRCLRAKISGRHMLMLSAVVTGVIVGLCAFILKRLIGGVSHLLTDYFNPDSFNLTILIWPLVGILLTGIYQRYILRHEIYHGVDRLGMAVNKRHYNLPFYLCYAPILASTLTLGFGGSAGSEGPIAYTGAAIGSNIGRKLRLDSRGMRFIIACGAAAGIAGIFKAPVGGALFAIEVLSIELSVLAILAIFVASIASWLMAFVCSGCTIDLAFHHMESLDGSLLPWVILLGVFCGLYSIYYSAVMHRMVCLYGNMKNPWIKNILSGSIVAVCVFLFPPLWGEGYGFIAEVLNGNASMITGYSLFSSMPGGQTLFVILAAAIIVVKPFATSSSNSGGGVAGDFAPTLFAGCITGYLFAAASNAFCGTHLPVGDFALMGMGAVMAGALRAPLMAIFLAIEMSGAYLLMLPVVLTAAISYVMVHLPHDMSRLVWFYRNRQQP